MKFDRPTSLSPFTTHRPYLCLSTNCTMNLEFNKNEDVLKQSLSDMRRRLEKIYEGGGKKAIDK